MKICALVDFMGSSFQDPEEEYAQIKQVFCEELNVSPDEITFLTDIQPHQLESMSTDIYVIDYGGLMPGSDGLIRSIFRDLIKQIDNKPNTLFVIWSQISIQWYKEAIKSESPELLAPNVVLMPHVDLENEWNRIVKWMSD